jgi:hypothetical protein
MYFFKGTRKYGHLSARTGLAFFLHDCPLRDLSPSEISPMPFLSFLRTYPLRLLMPFPSQCNKTSKDPRHSTLTKRTNY